MGYPSCNHRLHLEPAFYDLGQAQAQILLVLVLLLSGLVLLLWGIFQQEALYSLDFYVAHIPHQNYIEKKEYHSA